MVTNQGFKKVVVKLAITDSATSETDEKIFWRKNVPSTAGDPTNGDDSSGAIAGFTGTKSGTIEIIENGISQVDETCTKVVDSDPIKDNFGSLYVQVTDWLTNEVGTHPRKKPRPNQ